MRTLLLAATILFAAAAAAHGGPHTTTVANQGSLFDDPQGLADGYNANADQVPGIIVSLVKGERVNLHIDTGDEVQVVGLVMEGKQIGSVQPGGVNDSTVDVHTSLDTLDQIAQSPEPGKDAVTALKKGDIRIKTKGAIRSALFGVTTFLVKTLGPLLF